MPLMVLEVFLKVRGTFRFDPSEGTCTEKDVKRNSQILADAEYADQIIIKGTNAKGLTATYHFYRDEVAYWSEYEK